MSQQKTVVNHQISHDNNMDTIKTNEKWSRNVVSLKSDDHMIRTNRNPKNALNSFYNKIQLINAIDCVPFGYKM